MSVASVESIIVEYELRHTPQKVWRALTDATVLAAWLMENEIRPIVGHKFNFRAPPVPGWNGVVECEVLVVEEFKRLSYSWRGGSDQLDGYGHRLDTVVTWILSPGKDGGTHLRLEHTGFTERDGFAFNAMGKGWRGHLAERIAVALDKAT